MFIFAIRNIITGKDPQKTGKGEDRVARAKVMISEYRSYELPPDFPVLVLDGEAWRISPVRSGSLHFHNCVEIGYCRGGSGKMIMNRTERTFQAGDVTLVAPHVHHTTWSDPDTASLWSYLFVDEEKLLGKETAHREPMKEMMTSGSLILHREEAPWASAIVEEMIREMREQEAGYRECVQGLMLTLTTRMTRFFSPEMAEQPWENPVLAPALSWIREHFEADFSMEDLAARCHLSPTHFRRLFREQIGTTPLDYLHQVRIYASCTLLLESGDSVASVAGQVGYASLSCFNRHFLRVMGEVPSRWRKTEEGPLRRSSMTFTGWSRAETTEELLLRSEQRRNG